MTEETPGATLEIMSSEFTDSIRAPATSDLSEGEAVQRCKAGDGPGHPAFRVLYERYAPEVFKFLKRVLGDRASAEDALQETFLKLHRGLDAYDPSRPLRPYVFQIARNVVIDALRVRQKRPRPEAIASDPPSDVDVARDAIRSERKAAVGEALASLDPENRSILVLRFIHGLKLEEIADGASCTVRTVRNRLRAAAVLLQRELRRRGLAGEVLS